MLDIKAFKSALEQLEEEKKIPREVILDVVEQAVAAAYKKDCGKKGQIIRAKFDLDTGKIDFVQVKIVVDESIVNMSDADAKEAEGEKKEEAPEKTEEEKPFFNAEHHILLEDARKIKMGAQLNDEIIFPLEPRDDYGRIAAQAAKQVIIQKIRDAEKNSILEEYNIKIGKIVSGIIQKTEKGNVLIDFNRITGILFPEDQIPGEFLRRGQRIRTYLYAVENTPRGITLRLSRTNPKFLEELFATETPEIQNSVVLIKEIAREAGSRSKIAVHSKDNHIDPVGSCVGPRGSRVNAITQELSGEKIDIIPWSEDQKTFINNAISPAEVISIKLDEKRHRALIEVSEDQLSLAIGKSGQNVRLAAKLTGWGIDIKGSGTEEIVSDSDADADSDK